MAYASFRKANMSDVDFIIKLERQPLNTFVQSYDKPTHQANLNNSDYHYLIAENENDQPIGFAILLEEDSTAIEWRRIIIADPGRGTGKAFMSDILTFFDRRGTPAIWLDVYPENVGARHVYSGLGFIEIRRTRYEKSPSGELVIMERKRPA